MPDDIHHYLARCQQRINTALTTQLNIQNAPYHEHNNPHTQLLHDACHYSLNNGGKRIRPALLYASAEAFDATIDANSLDTIACAIECIHAYSLVHDDLPAMDNDELRRGQPTCHKQYGEATAILVGDGLQAFAFELLAEAPVLSAEIRVQLIKQLAYAAGNMGMVGGQMIDLHVADTRIDINELQQMHALKTGALIRASVAMGAISAGADTHSCKMLDDYAKAIGLAFQVQDDILDIESDTHTLGKTQGADINLNKPTYPALLGIDNAKAKAKTLVEKAHNALHQIDKQAASSEQLQRLHEIANFVIARQY